MMQENGANVVFKVPYRIRKFLINWYECYPVLSGINASTTKMVSVTNLKKLEIIEDMEISCHVMI